MKSVIVSGGGIRNSNLELFRIITMLVIVAHHYVVNSGLIQMVYESSILGNNDIFLILFGWGGKTGINCFVLITGYFMCKSQITKKKFCKLFSELLFYNIIFFIIFNITGYQAFSLKELLKAVFPFFKISTDFTSCFLLFYLFIPFLNKLIQVLTEKEHIQLIVLSVFIYTILPSFMKATVVFNYITWFMVLYLIASYIQLYQKRMFNCSKIWAVMTTVSLAVSLISTIIMAYLSKWAGKNGIFYFFVSDSNKILALITAICAFLFFKNLKLKQSRVINTISSSVFGVLLIHANSDTMRQWLWRDTLKNISMYSSPWLVVHGVLSVLGVFCICVVIDQIRINLIEKPIEKIYYKKDK